MNSNNKLKKKKKKKRKLFPPLRNRTHNNFHAQQDSTETEIQLALNCNTNRVTKSSPLELLIGRTTRPYDLLLLDNIEEREIDISDVRRQAIKNIEISAKYDKDRFDKTKAKVVRYSLGDFVLRKNEERRN